MSGIKIVATGRYIPKKVVTNEDFTKIVETSDEWIVQRTGMKERHISAGEPTWLMGALAAKDAMERGGIDPQSIDLLIFTTVTGDYCTPSMACIVQGQIGCKNAMCFDINAACSGFVYALDMIRRYLACGDVKRALLISSETLSKLTDYTDRATCVLFGDAAGACIVEKSDGVFASDLGADGTKASVLYCKNRFEPTNPWLDASLLPEYTEPFEVKTDWLFMAGQEVYKFAVKAFPKAVLAACEKAGVKVADLKLIVPHQANIRIVETAAKTLGVPMDKMYLNVQQFGNTSSACTPLCLYELEDQHALQRGDLIAMVGFGAGVTYGACVFEW